MVPALKSPVMTSAATKAEMIDCILSTAKQAAICCNRADDFQARVADSFITLAFMSEAELVSICRKIGVIK